VYRAADCKLRSEVSPWAIAVSDGLRGPLAERGEGLLFGAMGGQAMLLQLKSKRPGYTVHGLRSTFRDWATDHSGINGAETLAEYALAHRIDDAYARSDMFDRRRALMQAWADFATA
jgi:integrase